MRPDGDGGGTPGSSAVPSRDRREVPEPLRRLYPGSEVAPGRGAAGRWSEGVLTKPKPQAARYPAGCPPLSAAKCGEAEEACPNVGRGYGGGNSPRAYRHSGEGGAKLPISARYLRAWAAQASRGTQPSPPAILRAWRGGVEGPHSPPAIAGVRPEQPRRVGRRRARGRDNMRQHVAPGRSGSRAPGSE